MAERVRSTAARILVVDDDQSINQILVEALTDEGYEVFAARSAREALEQAGDAQPRVILLDAHLPDMSGEEFARDYRATPGPHAALVIVSGASDIAALAARIGAAAAVPKPFDLDELLAILEAQTRHAAA
jgi:DNA-binding response OmpR family regulator